MGLIRIELQRAYDPSSPALFGPMVNVGFCLGRESLVHDVYVWVDFAAPIVSGTVATVFLQTSRGLEIASKLIQRTHDGRWWALSWGTREDDSVNAVPLDHPRVRMLAIAAEVVRVEIPRSRPHEPHESSATPELLARLAQISQPAFADWRRNGLPPRAVLPLRPSHAVPDFVRELRCW